MIRYPIFIEPGTAEAAFGVVVPDLPGCFSAGDTLDEAMDAAREAAVLWIDAARDAGTPIPPPSSLESVRHQPDFAGWILRVVELDPALLRNQSSRGLAAELLEIGSHCAALPVLDHRSVDEILGYDDHGVPR